MKHIIAKLAILAVLAVTTIQSAAQVTVPIPDSNAIWSVYQQKYIAGGDTSINNLTYTKIYYSSDSLANPHTWQLLAFIREDSMKVYGMPKDSTKEYLLYDWGLEVGDTARVHFLITPYIQFATQVGSVKIQVMDVDSVSLGGQIRKQYQSAPVGYTAFNDEYWIEGIGSTYGLLTPSLQWFGASEYPIPKLVCFSENELLIYDDPDEEGCFVKDPYLGTGEEQAMSRFTLYPSPSSTTWHIESTFKFKKVEVFDATGRRVEVPIHSDGSFCKIDIHTLPAGIYLIGIQDQNIVQMQRAIKTPNDR